MTEVSLFVLVFIAIGCGFWLGRRTADKTTGSAPEANYAGLNFLLNEEASSDVDAFIKSLPVNPETLATHMALGNLLRRKGEVDGAIKVHQNLLSRPALDAAQQQRAQLELARDFIKAGLLDRAESLLRALVDSAPELKDKCLEHLIEIYRDEQEWEQAIAAVKLLAGRRFHKMASPWAEVQSHFCVELAELAAAKNDSTSARRYLKRALAYDKASVRASLLWGELECQLENYRDALKILTRIPQQDPDYLPEALEPITRCYLELDDNRGLQEFLRQTLDEFPSNGMVLALAETIQREEGGEAAAQFLGGQLKQRPSIRGLSRLLDLHLERSEGAALENLQLLKQSVDKLQAHKPSYRCQRCGFPGNQLHWLCPGCKSWGSVKAIKGLEGE